MARFYEITVTPKGGAPKVWSSFPGDAFDPGALNVEFDLLTGVGAVPLGASTITIEGIGLRDMQQAKQYAYVPKQGAQPEQPGALIQIKGGMKSPPGSQFGLVTPTQAGLLLQGEVFQSFGNWVNTEMNLNFVFFPPLYTSQRPGNLRLDWQEGQQLSLAIENMLSIAYPGVSVLSKIGSYVNNYPVGHSVSTLSQMAKMLKSITRSATSTGVDVIRLSDGSFLVADGTTKPAPIQLNFNDLIGQPQWVQPSIMQFSTVMRADIQPGSHVKMPRGLPNAPGAVTIGSGSAFPSQLKYQTAFQGVFTIIAARHVGSFRDTDGASWATLFQAAAVSADA